MFQFDVAIIQERPLFMHFHSRSLTLTFNPKARSTLEPTLIFHNLQGDSASQMMEMTLKVSAVSVP